VSAGVLPGSSAGAWSPSGRTTVLVVDDHTTFAELAEFALAAEPDIDCVGTAYSVADALAKARALRPDVVVMDVHLGDGDGVAATAELTEDLPDLRVVILSAHLDDAVVQSAAEAGASAVLAKDGSLGDLLHAVRTCTRGHLLVNRQVLALRSAVPAQARADSIRQPLTPREQEVLQMLGSGAGVHVIARELGISLGTCRGHVKSVLTKLGAHSQLEAVVLAMQHRLIQVGTTDAS
jgi:DNA-binding NarL/FixJ family response regulator